MKLFVSAVIASMLAGCTVGPDYHRPDLPVNEHYQALPETAGSAPVVDIEQWWMGFEDPVLNRIVSQVLARNLDLAAAQARVAQARAQAAGARANLLPQGSLDGSIARERQSTVGEFGTVASHLPGYNRNQTLRQLGAGASWELDLAGGLHRRAEALGDEARAAEATGMGTRITIVAEAADAYWQLRGTQAALAVLDAQIVTDTGLLQVTDRRVHEGVAIDREADDVEARLQQDQSLRPALQARLQLQMNRLCVLMGAAPGQGGINLDSDGNGSWTTPGIAPDLRPAQLLRRRPDVIAAEQQLAAATAGIGVALSQYYPDVSLAALLGFERLGSGDLFSAAAFQPAVLAGVHWRLFDFGRVDAEVAQARGAQAEALARYRQSVLQATEDAEDALVQLAQSQARLQDLTRVVGANEHAVQSIGRSADAGTASDSDILKRRQQLLQAQLAVIAAQEDRARATVDVYRALGGGWPQEAAAGYGRLSNLQ